MSNEKRHEPTIYEAINKNREEEEKRNVETEKGEEGKVGGSWNGGGEGAGREGLGNASCIGEHKRSRNNTIGKRAKHRLTRVRTFRAPTRVALLHVVCAGIRKKGTSVRGSERARRNARVIFILVRARTSILFLYVHRTQDARRENLSALRRRETRRSTFFYRVR
ncbi:PREDICTED: uncharacterized protein LOC105153389 [Acromyrmex echinatior]|uniref:uncharacterized protein LOC105153389 n=1 Tax=Acromyrmex echinatior TaxID=103372 RepID=UPI000580E987|nr:PREDICTED: uncharacterized protein LOC105153389 [Acromyrmex echinatior]